MRRLLPIVLLLAACGEDTLTPPDLTPVASVVVGTPQDTLILSETVALTAFALSAGGDTLPGRQIVWSSNDPAIASVSAGGQVTAHTAGSTAIVATIGGVSGSRPLTIRTLQFTMLRPGGTFTCGLTTAGEAWCWGSNYWGELGTGSVDSTSPELVPHPVAGSVRFTTLASGYNAVCGVAIGGAVYCWGYNGTGQLGDGTTINRRAPVAVAGLTGASAVTWPAGHTCAIAGGQAYCWGYNQTGELGDGTRLQRLTPVAVTGAPPLSSIHAADALSCGLTGAGAAWCWGNNAQSQLGTDTVYYRTSPTPVSGGHTYTALAVKSSRSCGLLVGGAVECWGFRRVGEGGVLNHVPVSEGGPTTYTAIDEGEEHACGLDAQGHAWCWGGNQYGQLGSGAFDQSDIENPATAVSGGLTFTSLVAGAYHSCGLTAAGAAWCWGYGTDGSLGDGNGTNAAAPVQVAGGHQFTRLAAGDFRSCGIDVAGAAWCWGDNNNGQLGDNSHTRRLVPVAVSGGLSFSRIDLGSTLSCGLTTTGALYCWGYLGAGGLGDGVTVASDVPVDVSGGQTYSRLAVGSSHSCVIATSGGTYCWGYNSSGELGDGTVTLRTTPVPVGGGPAFVDVAVGDMHTCGLTAAGLIQCWGSQYDGMLGDGVHTDSPIPLAVGGGLSFTDLAVGAATSSAACGLIAGGDVYCWPYGNSRTPILYPGGVSFGSLEAGGTLICGVALAGAGYCWGMNDQGQLGTGSVSPPGNGFGKPQLVTGGFQFASIAAGFAHACGLTSGGVAYCWGDNSSGQLGAAGVLQGGVPYPVKVMGQP